MHMALALKQTLNRIDNENMLISGVFIVLTYWFGINLDLSPTNPVAIVAIASFLGGIGVIAFEFHRAGHEERFAWMKITAYSGAMSMMAASLYGLVIGGTPEITPAYMALAAPFTAAVFAGVPMAIIYTSSTAWTLSRGERSNAEIEEQVLEDEG